MCCDFRCVLELSPNFTWLTIVTSYGPNELISNSYSKME